jgi:two-component sensor histidine kinase/CHASE3 domain sensor protein
MPISRRYLITSTLLLLAVGAAALIFLVGASVWLSQRAQNYADLVEQQRLIRSHALLIRDAVLTAESSQRGYVLTSNEIYLAPYENAKLVARNELLLLSRDIAPTGRFQRMMPRLAELVDQRLRDLDGVIEVKTASGLSAALASIATNQGKALMDEVQVFLSAIVLEAEDSLAAGLREQTANITALRIGTMLASLLILAVVAGVVVTFIRYTREIVQGRDDLASANASLETRVAERTEDLVRARDRAEVLLTEVNHRVANSLSFVSALISLQRQSIKDPTAKSALDETRTRIQAVAEIHKHLYTTGDVTTVSLQEYLSALLSQLEHTLASEGHGASIRHEIEPIRIPTSAGINLGIVITEWVTNAFKYAYGGNSGEVRVHARKIDDRLHLAVEDDGVGFAADGPVRGTGVGSKIVATIARSLKADIDFLRRNPGTEARLIMPLAAG